VHHLRQAGVEVDLGVEEQAIRHQLAPYLWQRETTRPYVVVKVASTLDGVVAMADGSSQWITGADARRDAHLLRAQSQAILVGAATVRRDDPSLTARLDGIVLEPLRVVLGSAPATAKVRPCLELSGDLGLVLDELGRHDVLQLLVEGGPTTTSSFFEAGLVNRVIWYQTAAFGGGVDTLSALSGLSTPTMEALRRGRLLDVRRVGDDIRVDVEV
jgi:diaminohydroxyphosphoribosylaminopyrimidine deaminase/5-amino-6-(5-phosphoribosylamino)uracil reductase